MCAVWDGDVVDVDVGVVDVYACVDCAAWVVGACGYCCVVGVDGEFSYCGAFDLECVCLGGCLLAGGLGGVCAGGACDFWGASSCAAAADYGVGVGAVAALGKAC